MPKQTKVITKRRKFIEVDIPLIRQKLELIGSSIDEVEGRTIKLDLTRQLKGKSVEVVVKIKSENGKAIAYPTKIKLMPYFIRRVIRKRISYVEDSFEVKSQESLLIVKPFLITRKRVSRAVRKALRNRAKNWLEDYILDKTDNEIFNEILSNRMQRPLSLVLKKTYPLSMCEIRVLEVKRKLEKDEVPEKKERKTEKKEEAEFVDQFAEIEEERVKKAQEEIKKTQEKAAEIGEEMDEGLDSENDLKEMIEESEEKPDSEIVEKKEKKAKKKEESEKKVIDKKKVEKIEKKEKSSEE